MTDEVCIYKGVERRKMPSISEEQMNALAERAAVLAASRAAAMVAETVVESVAEKAAVKAARLVRDEQDRAVGQTIREKAWWAVGVLVGAAWLWAKSQGLIK